jgi:hypothetical protein
MFIIALFTIAKLCDQLSWPKKCMDNENVVCMHNGVLFNHKEEWNETILFVGHQMDHHVE